MGRNSTGISRKSARPKPDTTHQPSGSAIGSWKQSGRRSYADYVEISSTGLPLPSVPLLTVLRTVFKGPLKVERIPVALKACSRRQVAELCAKEPEDGGLARVGETETVDAEVKIRSVLCLALGPRSGPGDIGMLFHAYFVAELSVGGEQRELTFDRGAFPLYARPDSWFGEGLAWSVAARLDSGWHRVSGFGSPGWRVAAGGFGNGGYSPGIDYRSKSRTR